MPPVPLALRAQHEALVDMIPSSDAARRPGGALCCGGGRSVARRRYKWLVFSDGLLLVKSRDPWPIMRLDEITLRHEAVGAKQRQSVPSPDESAFIACLGPDANSTFSCTCETEAETTMLFEAVRAAQERFSLMQDRMTRYVD